MRREIASKDAFVRRARPTTIYVINLCILLQVISGAAVICYVPDALSDYVSLVEALANPLMVALAVIGVYKYGRTKEKMVDSGGPGSSGNSGGPGLFSRIASAVAGKSS